MCVTFHFRLFGCTQGVLSTEYTLPPPGAARAHISLMTRVLCTVRCGTRRSTPRHLSVQRGFSTRCPRVPLKSASPHLLPSTISTQQRPPLCLHPVAVRAGPGIQIIAAASFYRYRYRGRERYSSLALDSVSAVRACCRQKLASPV
eukprot:7391575-Prymnesium_polylepis.2